MFKRNRRSPDWALMEKFIIPHYDDPLGEPYLVRWRIVQTPWFGVYLHKINTADPRSTLHNHPWPFLSVILKGGYLEARNDETFYARCRKQRRINIMRLEDWHWIVDLDRVPTWTLMFVGKRRRVWEYQDRDGMITRNDLHQYHKDYLEALETRFGSSE